VNLDQEIRTNHALPRCGTGQIIVLRSLAVAFMA
jgi:hypothetical protein